MIQKNNISKKKSGNKNGKALYMLMNNVVYGKIMENLRKRVDVRFVSNKKDYLKWKSKPDYVSQKKLTTI